MKRIIFVFLAVISIFLISSCCVGEAQPWPELFFSLSTYTAKPGDTIILDMNGVNIFENDRYTEWKVYLTDSTVNDQEITQTKVISATQLEIVLPQNAVSKKEIFIRFEGNPPDSLGPCESSEEDREYYSCASSDEKLIIVDENGNEITE